MSIELRPMSGAEYDAWLPVARDRYAADIADAGVPEADARAKADHDFPALLPSGVDTPGQDLYVVTADGDPVGVLWLAERDRDGERVLFVYDIEIDDAHRGRGLGRAAMQRVEAEARRRGLDTVALNVFGGNTVARNLYRSLGYAEIAIWMSKRV
jgi:ribosomal protein S18 acetylase RimI-like enzyme